MSASWRADTYYASVVHQRVTFPIHDQSVSTLLIGGPNLATAVHESEIGLSHNLKY